MSDQMVSESPVLSRTGTAIEAKGRTVYTFRFIPARVSVLIFTPLLLIISVLMVTGGAIIAEKLEHQFSNFQRLVVFLHILNYLTLACACCVGLYAAICMRPKAAQLFIALLFGQFLFGVASGAMCMRILFAATGAADTCASLVQGSAWIQKNVCGRTSSLKGLVVGGFLLFWFLEIVTLYVAMRLSRQLQDALVVKELDENYDYA